jgi:hypothetical protein
MVISLPSARAQQLEPAAGGPVRIAALDVEHSGHPVDEGSARRAAAQAGEESNPGLAKISPAPEPSHAREAAHRRVASLQQLSYFRSSVGTTGHETT